MGVTTARMMRWGPIPYSGESAYPLINATVEKLTTWYGWGYLWEHGRRCMFAISGFYEPHVFPGGRKDRSTSICGIAGLRRGGHLGASEGRGRRGGSVMRGRFPPIGPTWFPGIGPT